MKMKKGKIKNEKKTMTIQQRIKDQKLGKEGKTTKQVGTKTLKRNHK